MKKFILSYFVTIRLYISIGVVIALYTMAFFVPVINWLPRVGLLVIVFIIVLDTVLLYGLKNPIATTRLVPDKLSNGDANSITLQLQNKYAIQVFLNIIEELPYQFQKRDFNISTTLKPKQYKEIKYELVPVERGVYDFGSTLLFVTTSLGLIQRRVALLNNIDVPCYPSFKKLNRYSINAISNKLTEVGVKQIRKMGNSSEFEQVKEYVKGDDIRSLNWKASARKNQLMVNHYTDEKSQQIYSIINVGRVMKMPFDNLSLLDHAINASLILTNVAIGKKDKAGLITFSNKTNNFLPADSKPIQLNYVLETLYKQDNTFLESDFEKLYALIRQRINHRSLLVLYTNFETFSAMERELPYLRKMAAHHLLLVVFFENTEIKKMVQTNTKNVAEVYAKTIAEKFTFEKKKIVKELNNNGILTLLTAPKDLTVNAVNRYLELKMRNAI